MNQEAKNKAKEILSMGIMQIVNNYTENALLINACFVSADRYNNLTDTTGLSTIDGIPSLLRLDNEIDVQFSNEDLTEKYSSDVLTVIFKNYIVVSISIVDAVLEEVYELMLKTFETDISDFELDKKVRSAWANDSLISYLVSEDKCNFKKPKGIQSEILEAFMRYKELRIIRHSLVHSNGLISERNMSLLNQFNEQTPDERKKMALINSPMISSNGEVVLSINIILSIRQYLDRFLMYVYKSISNA